MAPITDDPQARPVRPRRGEAGASLISYALILALIATVTVGAVSALGPTVRDSIDEAAQELDEEEKSECTDDDRKGFEHDIESLDEARTETEKALDAKKIDEKEAKQRFAEIDEKYASVKTAWNDLGC